MAKYQGTDGSVIEVGDASLNPSLVAGRTLVSDTTPLSTNSALNTPGAPGYNPTGGTPSPYVPTSGSINRSIDPNADPASSFLNTFNPPQTADQIAEQKRKDAQGSIDAINKTYDDQLSQARQSGQERLNQDNAVSVLSGLMGSTEAGASRSKVNAANDKELAAINNKRALDLSSIYTKISQDAAIEADHQKQDATKSAQDILTRREAAQSKAIDGIKTLASGGLVDFDSFKSSPQNAQVYKYALDAAGGSEDNLRAIFAMNRPKDQLVGTPQRVGDHFVQAYQNPITGKVAYDTINIPGGIPPEYKSFQKIGNEKTGEFLYAIPENWDGDQSKLKLVASTKGVTPQESIANGLTDANGKPLKLTAAQVDTLSGFDSTVQVANEALSLIRQGVKTGPVEGNLLQGKKFFGIQDPNQLKLESTIGKLRADFMKAISGAAVSESEVKRLSTFLPSITDQESVVESKLHTLIAETQRTKSNLVSTLGGTSGGASDLRGQVTSSGYDYDAMRADGLTDAQIKNAIGL